MGGIVPAPLSGHTVRTGDPFDRPDDDGVRLARYGDWRRFAAGEQWPRREAGDPRERLVFNYARSLVRKVASYVFPQPVTFDISGPGDEDHSAAERLLNDTIRSLGLGELDLTLEIERSTIGDAAVKVTWDGAAARPRVVSVDPGNLVVTFSPENPREAVEVRHLYQLPGFALIPYGFEILTPDAWLNVSEVWTVDRWEMHVAGLGASKVTTNPYGWIPYVFLPNDPHPRRFWGQSDLIDVEHVTRSFNRELSTLRQIMDLSGAPIAVLEGVDSSDGISARPGAKWELPPESRAYLLDLLGGGGVRLHIDYLSELRTTLHDLSETPRTAFGDTGRALSGAALEVEIQPLVQRVGRKRAGWERFYTERNRRLLDLLARFGGVSLGDHRTTVTNWASVLPSDEAQLVRDQVSLVGSQIRSRRKAAEVLGETDPDSELTQIVRELEQLTARHADTGRSEDPERPGDTEGDEDGDTDGDL